MLTPRLLLLSSLIFAQYHHQEWGSITSLLTPTGIQIAADGTVFASTSGGLLEFNPNTKEFNFIKLDEGLIYLDLSTVEMDSLGRLWLGGAYPNGYLQVYDPDKGLVKKITHLDKVTQIKLIRIGTQKAYAAYEGSTSSDIGILEFDLDGADLPEYHDYYTNFSTETITEIRDLDLFQDSILYVTTDQGIFVGYESDNLKLSESWNIVYEEKDARQFLPGDSPIALLDSSILYNNADNWVANCATGFKGQAIQAEQKGDVLYILTNENYYEIIDCVVDSFHIPIGYQIIINNALGYDLRTFFTSFDFTNDGSVFMGINNNGLLHYKEMESYVIYTPNTPVTNIFSAITTTKSGDLAATSHLGTLYFNGLYSRNYIPKNYYKYFSGSSDPFYVMSIDYSPGEHEPFSIIERDNRNLILCNSGVVPSLGGAIIELDYLHGNITKYDNNNGVIDGFWGIYSPSTFSEYMVVNQIEKDQTGNIWIINPFCERHGNLLAIQSDDDSWSHVSVPDSSSFRPQTIAFDQKNRAWIGFAYDAQKLYGDPFDNRIYSAGGIKVFNSTDSSWISISNPEKLPGNNAEASVWSMTFDHMDFLWVMNEKGIRGFTYSMQDNNIILDPLLKTIDGTAIDFLSHVSYAKGNRIRIDSKNNKWIITHKGIWIIQESMVFWPNEEGLHPDNSGLLSDKVYDVAFDNDKGLAYLATDKGISILQIPFAENSLKTKSIYISPNPFILPDHERVIIKNVPTGSTIQIMTITGSIIKEIKLPANQSQVLWDGTNQHGEIVGTAVYLVAAHHSTEHNKVSKIAVIRK